MKKKEATAPDRLYCEKSNILPGASMRERETQHPWLPTAVQSEQGMSIHPSTVQQGSRLGSQLPVDVSLDKNTVHRGLTISGDGKSVSLEKNVVPPTTQGTGGSGTTFSAVGQNCFATGRCYWEVKVLGEKEMGHGARWALGICPETVNRAGWFVENTEKNFWLVAYKEGKVTTLTSKPESLSLRSYPERIGVFLDWEAGDLSFYNMVDGSHIYSYTGINFCGKFQPYFSLQGAGTSMTICSASGQTENVPSSSAETSVTHLRNCDTDVPQETNTLLSP